ncbi:MAG: thrombospondin type 3 repeat-containing protein [Deltaproteobacteria bacterium]|nr:thrombospondin type 3 repeat-containing protein [Deltaproteobacteria bacterium]
MRNPRGVGAIVALGLSVAVANAALAQSPPNDRAIDVQTFEYAIGPKALFTVSDAEVAAKRQLAVDALITFMTAPFKIYNVDPETNEVGEERTTVVESITSAQLTVAYGIDDRIQVGANLPIIFALTGEGLMASTGMPDPNGLSVTGLGDLVLEGKMRFHRDGSLRLGAIGQLSIPTSVGSNESQFIGDNLPTVRAKLAAQYDTGRVSLGANTGVILRKPRTIYDSTIGQQLTWGAGAAVRLTNKFSLIGEGFGRAGLPDFSLDASPLEVIGGLRLYATNAVAVVVGGGAGLVKGIGSPESRFFVSIGYSPDVRDTDGDGIANARDKCPMVAEDRDGWEDDDGCPDDDNDGDRRPDDEDKCPTVAEDLDGFDDDDGCPELDNDGDKFADLQDKCPNDAEDGKEPQPTDGCPAHLRDSDGDGLNDVFDKCPSAEEDMDGFEDGDGCPEADNDNDGVADAADKCPLCPEDKDGFEDGDGCPETDNDRDGIADAQDKCPMEAESINGIKDDDGCPDTGGQQVVALDGDRLLIGKIPTLAGASLTPAGTQIVDQVALLMNRHPEVTKWLIALAQPKADAAKKLADAIKARLVAKGVPAAHLEVLGAAGPAKIGGVVQERGEEGAFVCPAGKEVQQRPETIPAPAMPVKSEPALPPKDSTTKPTPAPQPQSDEIEID